MNLVNYFVPLGYAIYAVDHIGHGKSEGTRKHVDSFSDFSDTLDIYLERVKEWHGDNPLFLLGHSMGGLIAAHYLLANEHEFTGTILSAPALKIRDDVPLLKIMIGKLISLVLPKVGILPINPTEISRDPKVVESYMNDPLIHKGNTSARLAAELLKAMDQVQNGTQGITLPLLILQGTDDAIVNPDGAQRYFDSIASTDKTLKYYPGMYHEPFNEPEKAQVFNDIKKWLAAH